MGDFSSDVPLPVLIGEKEVSDKLVVAGDPIDKVEVQEVMCYVLILSGAQAITLAVVYLGIRWFFPHLGPVWTDKLLGRTYFWVSYALYLYWGTQGKQSWKVKLYRLFCVMAIVETITIVLLLVLAKVFAWNFFGTGIMIGQTFIPVLFSLILIGVNIKLQKRIARPHP